MAACWWPAATFSHILQLEQSSVPAAQLYSTAQLQHSCRNRSTAACPDGMGSAAVAPLECTGSAAAFLQSGKGAGTRSAITPAVISHHARHHTQRHTHSSELCHVIVCEGFLTDDLIFSVCAEAQLVGCGGHAVSIYHLPHPQRLVPHTSAWLAVRQFVVLVCFAAANRWGNT